MKKMYFLSIVPPTEVSKRLQKIITNLSEKYNAPNFNPHITLLGNVSSDLKTVKRNAKLLVSKLKPFPITFSEISFSTTYFKSVFIRVKATAELMDANMLAKEIFKLENNVYMPHMSLIYGNHTMKEREDIIFTLELPKNISFNASKLVIVQDTGNPNDWVHIAEFEIK